MKTYYYQSGAVIGQAWSTMECDQSRHEDIHRPHVHNPEFTLYGPYLCPGWTGEGIWPIYDTPPRVPQIVSHRKKES